MFLSPKHELISTVFATVLGIRLRSQDLRCTLLLLLADPHVYNPLRKDD